MTFFVCVTGLQDLVSLRSVAYRLQDSSSTLQQKKKDRRFGCPVEVLSPHPLPLEEKNALVQEMQREFLNMRKVFISGLPPDSSKEVALMFELFEAWFMCILLLFRISPLYLLSSPALQ